VKEAERYALLLLETFGRVALMCSGSSDHSCCKIIHVRDENQISDRMNPDEWDGLHYRRYLSRSRTLWAFYT